MVFSLLTGFLAIALQVKAQEQPANPASTQPQVKVNMLNVCTPSAEEQKEIAAASGAHSEATVVWERFRSLPWALDA